MPSNLDVGRRSSVHLCFLVSFFHIKCVFFCTSGRLDLHHKVVFIAIIHMDFKYLMKSTGCAREWKRNRPDRVHVNEMENKVLIHHLLYNRYIFQPYFRRHVTCDSCNVRFYFSRYFFHSHFSFPVLPSSLSIWYHSATFFPLCIALAKWNFTVAHHFSLFIPLCTLCVFFVLLFYDYCYYSIFSCLLVCYDFIYSQLKYLCSAYCKAYVFC